MLEGWKGWKEGWRFRWWEWRRRASRGWGDIYLWFCYHEEEISLWYNLKGDFYPLEILRKNLHHRELVRERERELYQGIKERKEFNCWIAWPTSSCWKISLPLPLWRIQWPSVSKTLLVNKRIYRINLERVREIEKKSDWTDIWELKNKI